MANDIDIRITANTLSLDKRIIDWVLNTKNVNLMISLGGDKEMNDLIRVCKDNRPTFATIKNKKRSLKQ